MGGTACVELYDTRLRPFLRMPALLSHDQSACSDYHM